MFSLRTLPARVARTSIMTKCVRFNHSRTLPVLTSTTSPQAPQAPQAPTKYTTAFRSHPSRSYSTSGSGSNKSAADAIIEEIQDQYATARDEFEIATEETEKKTVYAENDRIAAREELDKLKEMFETACAGDEGEEIKKRIGHRVRELDNAVQALEQSAQEDH